MKGAGARDAFLHIDFNIGCLQRVPIQHDICLHLLGHLRRVWVPEDQRRIQLLFTCVAEMAGKQQHPVLL